MHHSWQVHMKHVEGVIQAKRRLAQRHISLSNTSPVLIKGLQHEAANERHPNTTPSPSIQRSQGSGS